MAYNNTDIVPLPAVVDLLVQFRTGTATNAKNDTIDQAMKVVLHEEL